ncbi:conserved hypothetical protein [Vibrio cholerae O1 str. 2010EL-1786]|uniref:Transposase n=3 Tax=Vibrio cholerae TaxID=666 RepID=Q9KSC7_VIBCH|nr:hypothetical protein VC_1331 [Vibrio cholerae O1 biovar El Tor str. N16961]ACP05602.1 conserved hypothetical protein [Vibrio cholerae M66-2]AET26437.1 conserved hypothetical protein [Vibrio cholerae O1 str. 2010EL-1786]EET22571.1 conserved hypothetical protein [Vibrio cholerae MO10]
MQEDKHATLRWRFSIFRDDLFTTLGTIDVPSHCLKYLNNFHH